GVTVSVTPAGQGIFRGWSGDACSGSTATTCQVTMSGDRTVNARFEAPVTVSVRGTGEGRGIITSTPAGISCNLVGSSGQGACTALFNEGTSISLSAAALSGNSFRGWGGDCAGQVGTTCILPITGTQRNVTAQFDPPAVITVVPTGTGDGQVFAGSVISCLRANGSNSGTCSATVPNGTTLTLTAIPDGESNFSGWTGACSGTGLCQVTVDQARTVTAVFTRRQVLLTLNLAAGSQGGFGSVSTSSGFTCTLAEGESSRQCSTLVDVSRNLTLTASPGVDQTFSGFSGACASSSVTCTFIVTQNASVTATFGPPTGLITVGPESNNTGTGTILIDEMMVSYPDGIDCSFTGTNIQSGSTCSQSLPGGTVVTLFALPGSGQTFAGWGGACSSFGSSTSCTITATGNVGVTARFIPAPAVAVTVTLSGPEGGILAISGSNFTQTCSRAQGEASPTTTCNLSVPSGQGFQVFLSPFGSAVGAFGSGTICANSSSPCNDASVSGITSPATVSASFFAPSAVRAKVRKGT
ncbi:MAG: hypothetical protein IBJ19_18270, partial [Gemmatimonadaceae bacterium]|nr:hypothetical protein [Gemmatimonadaceae bacterium]